MKELFLILVCLTIIPAVQAQEINCYSGAREIYHGQGKIIRWFDTFIEFVETGTHNHILTDAICKVSVSHKEFKDAFSKGKKQKSHEQKHKN